MIITAIVPSAKRRGRFALDVDGQLHSVLSLEAIERLHLTVGAELDDRGEETVRREAAIVRVYDRALSMLAFRARAARELARLLERKGETPESIAAAIDRLRAAGFVDDAAFARQFVRGKVTGGGISKRRLQQELARRGVARDDSDAAIADVFAEEAVDEAQSLERVARRKLQSLASVDVVTQRRRLYGFLARRGYDADDIARIVRELCGSHGRSASDGRMERARGEEA